MLTNEEENDKYLTIEIRRVADRFLLLPLHDYFSKLCFQSIRFLNNLITFFTTLLLLCSLKVFSVKSHYYLPVRRIN